MKYKLLPCPFCGNKPYFQRDKKSHQEFKLGCFDDYCLIKPQTGWRTFKDDAIHSWNKRKETPND